MNHSKLKEKQKETKNTPWTKLGIKVDLCSFLTRKVLVEKFSPQKAKESEMKEFFISKIDGCELFIHNNYENYVFYIKETNGNKEILMEKNEKNKTFYIKHDGIWSVFESRYMLQYDEIQSLTQGYLLDSLNSKGYKTIGYFFHNWGPF